MSSAQTRLPSGLNATPSTAHPDPRRLSRSAPMSASNSRTRPSTLAVAMRDPSTFEVGRADVGRASERRRIL